MFCPQGYFSPENSTECFACPLLLASVLARFNTTGKAERYGKVDLEGDQKVLEILGTDSVLYKISRDISLYLYMIQTIYPKNI